MTTPQPVRVGKLVRLLASDKPGEVAAAAAALNRAINACAVNLVNGRWSDFAEGAKGGDVVSLYAYLRGIGQGKAARELAYMLGVK